MTNSEDINTSMHRFDISSTPFYLISLLQGTKRRMGIVSGESKKKTRIKE